MEKSTANKIYRAIGLMSGTAMDGIDAALIETDGHAHVRPIAFETQSHDEAFRQKFRVCMNKPKRDSETDQIEREFTLRQIPVIKTLLDNNGLAFDDIDVIGFHGQTIHHDPDNALTIQLGDGGLLARETGVDVVYDFRTNDMKQGGQGAPLLPVYHRALALKSNVTFPIVVANIGGVGNITWITKDTMIAFDTGPGNAMMDDWVLTHTGKPYDDGGQIAARGSVDDAKLNEFLAHGYFAKPYPKSLDRNDFARFNVDGLTLEDGAATLTAMTVRSIALGVSQCPQVPSAIYVTGGGRHNQTIMTRLEYETGIAVLPAETLGWDGDAMESQGFAYMAVRTLRDEPISFPTTTGCAAPTVGGVIVPSKKVCAA